MNKFPAELADFRRFSTFLGGFCETYCSHLFTQLSITASKSALACFSRVSQAIKTKFLMTENLG
jgi:hypothetical protein